MEKQLQNIAESLEEINAHQFSYSTGQEIVDAINWVAIELKRMNDREENK